MKKSRLEDLEIFQVSVELSDVLWNIVVKWDNFSKNKVGTQLVRAIDSVGANLSEGYGKGSKLNTARFAKITRGSLFESKYWVDQYHRRKLIPDDQSIKIINKIDNRLSRISAYNNYLSKPTDKK